MLIKTLALRLKGKVLINIILAVRMRKLDIVNISAKNDWILLSLFWKILVQL